VRVELAGLDKDDLYRILTEPTYNLITQQIALMSTEGVTLSFTDDAIQRVAEVAADINTNIENIGARRLNTVLERITEEISFEAGERKGQEFEVGVELVDEKIGDMMDRIDLSKFVL
jgi:ATP-dependent HslUV protease ATP-binding subunit HslU